ncbi:NAD(P)/FAD-dependent oxidoreductase [Halorubellus sp. JP-L1]|uniref:phytoene desaturase family protein n=1 Tax=Halorubellus sp. JP-L1 TaxID=2715753 RepID=UPI00140D8BA9|nr:NAD(P)/FAD-dependent oxidoreductase [Halorubellus sp. JP-L1]NHN42911.1 NAD(P)/FAD-dependent oxidoreductase [Halorubellus sp. JP-L1]
MTERYDAIVVGAGHNGLVCATYLARAGLEPLVLERNDEVGGAVRSAELTRDGFVHDAYATNMNLFLGSPVWEDLQSELEAEGLSFAHSAKPYCSVFPDASALRVYQDEQETLAELESHDPDDAAGWQELYGEFGRFERTLLPLYATPLTPLGAARQLLSASREIGFQGVLDLLQIVSSSTRELGDAYFSSAEAKALLAPWGMHLDFGPDVSGGAMFPFLETFTDMEVGINVVEGGASNLVEALAGVCENSGGEVRTNAEVSRVLVDRGRAVGVELASGDRYRARDAVVANLTPTVLFEDLVPDRDVPPAVADQIEEYSYGPGTMMVHLALSERPDWDADGVEEFAYVHVGPYVEDMAETYTDAVNGQLPESPLLVVGQTTAVDPSRTPNDEHVLWVQVRALPSEIEGDAAGEIDATSWEAASEPYADRVIAKLAEYAPGIEDAILDRTVFTPADLEASNPNLVGGDSVAGSHHVRQNFLWRPFADWGNYETPIEDLYMVGAATWPGAGVNAISGYHAAQSLTTEETRVDQVKDRVASLASSQFGDRR